MNEIEVLKLQFKSIEDNVVLFERHAKKSEEVLEQLKSAVEDVSGLLLKVEAPRNKPALRENELKIIDELLTASLSFKPTTMVADFLRRKNDEFKELNNFQIGILLSKAGFVSGHNKSARGYHVSYRIL